MGTTLDDTAFQAEAIIRRHLETHSQGLSFGWVGQGHPAQVGTTCPYCARRKWRDWPFFPPTVNSSLAHCRDSRRPEPESHKKLRKGLAH